MATVVRNYRRDGTPVLEPGGDQPGRRRDRPGHPPHRDPGRRHATASSPTAARDLEIDLPHQATRPARPAGPDQRRARAAPRVRRRGRRARRHRRPRARDLGVRRGDGRPRPVRPHPPRRRRPGRPRTTPARWPTRTSAGSPGRPRVTEALDQRSRVRRARRTAWTTPACPAGRRRAQLELLRRLGLGSAMVVPLRARDRVARRADPRGRRRVHAGRRGDRRAPGPSRRPRARQRAAVPRRADGRADAAAQPAAGDPATSPGLDIAAAYIPSAHGGPRSAATGSTCSPCRTAPSAWRSATWSGTTCAPRRRWASSARCCARTRGRARQPGQVVGRARRAGPRPRHRRHRHVRATCAGGRPTTAPQVTYAGPATRRRCCGSPAARSVALDGGLSTPIGVDGSRAAPRRASTCPSARRSSSTPTAWSSGATAALRDGIAALTAALSHGPTTRTPRPGPRPARRRRWSARTRRTTCACSSSGARRPPREQLVARGVRAQRPALHPQLEQVPVGLARPRGPADSPRISMICVPSRSGRIDAELLLLRAAARSAPRGRRTPRDSRAALRRLRVVQSERVSRCSRSSSGPASVT